MLHGTSPYLPKRRSRSEFASTDTLDSDMAALAKTGDSSQQHAALKALADDGAIKPAVVAEAIAKYKIDAGRAAPWTV